jgi:hypothetical protein
MEHSGAEYHDHHEEEGDSRVESSINDSEHLGLAQSADESEHISNEVEFPNLQHVNLIIFCG